MSTFRDDADFLPMQDSQGRHLANLGERRYRFFMALSELVLCGDADHRNSDAWRDEANCWIDQIVAEGLFESLADEARDVLRQAKGWGAAYDAFFAKTPTPRHPNFTRPEVSRIRFALVGAAAISIMGLVILIYWSQQIESRAQAAGYAAWAAYRSEHCEQKTVVVDRRAEYPVYQCDDATEYVVDRGYGRVPDRFQERVQSAVLQARCQARRDILPWDNPC